MTSKADINEFIGLSYSRAIEVSVLLCGIFESRMSKERPDIATRMSRKMLDIAIRIIRNSPGVRWLGEMELRDARTDRCLVNHSLVLVEIIMTFDVLQRQFQLLSQDGCWGPAGTVAS